MRFYYILPTAWLTLIAQKGLSNSANENIVMSSNATANGTCIDLGLGMGLKSIPGMGMGLPMNVGMHVSPGLSANLGIGFGNVVGANTFDIVSVTCS